MAKHWRRTKEYRRWIKECKKRDGNKCVITGSSKRLEVHHKNSGSFFPDERYDLDNGVTIHRFVHILFHWFYMKSTRHKCTKKDWKRFERFFKYVRLISDLLRKNKM